MNRLSRKVLALIVGPAALLAVRWSGAATFNIANGDVAGLITAINMANSNSQNDDINLAASGTYILTNVNNMNDGPNGLPTITGDSGHQLNIYGNGATITRSPSAPAFRIFFILASSESLALNDLTITNGSIAGGGGAIENAASLSLSRCVLSGNSVSHGDFTPGWGGAIYNHGTSLAVDSCTFTGNHASNASGAIYSARGNLTVTNSTFTGNTSAAGAGAIDIVAGTTPSISYSTFSQNEGDHGGAVRIGGISASMINCTLTNNRTSEAGNNRDGGAIAIDTTGGLAMTSCTVIGNSASPGRDISNAGSLTIRNTILSDLYNNVGTVASQGYNISQSPNSLLNGPGDQTNTDPQLDPLGLRDNGGPTQTIALTHNSPAIDKGNAFGTPIDQRGVARPYDNPSIPNANGGDGSDVGAYEAPQDQVQGGSNFLVTTTDDHDDGLCSGVDCTLREAVARANTVPGASSIGFAHTLSGTITLIMGELAVTDSLTITGIPIGTISGNNASRVFNFSGGSNYLFGLTIRDGLNEVNFPGQTNTGGGIYNSATLSVYGCSFVNNHAVGVANIGAGSGGKGEGGGIYNSGTLLVDGSTFSQTNEAMGGNGGNGNLGHGGVPSGNGGAGQGGAVFNDTGASLTVTNCTFGQNVAVGGNGGSGGPAGGNGGNGDGAAVFNLGTMTIKSSTIDGNAGASGTPGSGTVNGMLGTGCGGLFVAGGTANVANTISAGNSGTNSGGGDANGLFVSTGYNLIGNGDFSTGFNASGDQVGTTAAPINPRLGPLQNNGGGTNTMALLTNSPAIDQGKSFGLAADQRGHERPFDVANISNASGGDGSDIGAFELGGTLTPVSTVSRKMHGAAGPFDIPLPLAGNTGVECRSGGATGDYQIVLTFAAPVAVTGNPQAQITSGAGQIGTGGTTNGGVVSVNGAIVTVPLTNVANAQRITLTLSGASDGANTNNVSVPIGFLLGDTNGDGLVNSGDSLQTRSRSGQATDATNFRSDVNADGFVNSGDTTVVRARSGTFLP